MNAKAVPTSYLETRDDPAFLQEHAFTGWPLPSYQSKKEYGLGKVLFADTGSRSHGRSARVLEVEDVYCASYGDSDNSNIDNRLA